MHVSACMGTISLAHTSCVRDIDFDALRQRLYIACSSDDENAGGSVSVVGVYDCNGWSKQCCWQLEEKYGNIHAMVCATYPPPLVLCFFGFFVRGISTLRRFATYKKDLGQTIWPKFEFSVGWRSPNPCNFIDSHKDGVVVGTYDGTVHFIPEAEIG